MKITALTQNVRVLAKEATPSKDGQNTYYKATVLIGTEAGSISCTKEVYDLVENDKTYDLTATYNSEYKTFKFEQVAKIPVADSKASVK